MSKRFFSEHQGDRKRAKLDISISDHNFPLSQNKVAETKEADTWGDDYDDEILLLASQACEEAYKTNEVSLLPDYSLCMQPGSTSTQMSSPGPSTSKTEFTFKKPSTNPSSMISTQLRDKCNRTSSMFNNITAKVTSRSHETDDLTTDLIFNDKIYKGHDSNHAYRQLLQLQEENAKLKSENGKLLEKCVTKEGEASILRTQLKTCQSSVDNARLEKLKAQEKVQMEWTDKLAAANNHMSDLRNQLDFKNLEIISIKEKCKKLESTKVRLTQVTVANNDISRPNSSYTQNESMTVSRRFRTSSNGVQTDNMAHFLALNKTFKAETFDLPTLLSHILEPTTTPYSLLDYNENLTHTDAPYKCTVHTMLHRDSSAAISKGSTLQLATLYEDIAKIANGCGQKERYFRVFNAAKSILNDVLSRLEMISQRMTAAFHKEMEEKYLQTTINFLWANRADLLKGRELYKEEQEILARRVIAVLSYILEFPNAVDMFKNFEKSTESNGSFKECVVKIYSLLDATSSAVLYSGLLVSLSYTAGALSLPTTARGAGPVSLRSLRVAKGAEGGRLCARGAAMDCDNARQEKNTCYLQTLVKQVEACLKCIESQDLKEQAANTTRDLIMLYCNLKYDSSEVQDKSSCDCQLVLMQAIVYALRICAVMLQNSNNECNSPHTAPLTAACRCGAALCARAARPPHREGHLMHFCDILCTRPHSDIYANLLSELAGSLLQSPEEMPPSFHKQPWLKSFESFSITD